MCTGLPRWRRGVRQRGGGRRTARSCGPRVPRASYDGLSRSPSAASNRSMSSSVVYGASPIRSPPRLAETEVVRRLPGVEVAGRRVDVPVGQGDGHVGRVGVRERHQHRRRPPLRPRVHDHRQVRETLLEPLPQAVLVAPRWRRTPTATGCDGRRRRRATPGSRRLRSCPPAARRAGCRARTAPAPGWSPAPACPGRGPRAARARPPAHRSAGRGTCRANRRRGPRRARPGRWPRARCGARRRRTAGRLPPGPPPRWPAGPAGCRSGWRPP